MPNVHLRIEDRPNLYYIIATDANDPRPDANAIIDLAAGDEDNMDYHPPRDIRNALDDLMAQWLTTHGYTVTGRVYNPDFPIIT